MKKLAMISLILPCVALLAFASAGAADDDTLNSALNADNGRTGERLDGDSRATLNTTSQLNDDGGRDSRAMSKRGRQARRGQTASALPQDQAGFLGSWRRDERGDNDEGGDEGGNEGGNDDEDEDGDMTPTRN